MVYSHTKCLTSSCWSCFFSWIAEFLSSVSLEIRALSWNHKYLFKHMTRSPHLHPNKSIQCQRNSIHTPRVHKFFCFPCMWRWNKEQGEWYLCDISHNVEKIKGAVSPKLSRGCIKYHERWPKPSHAIVNEWETNAAQKLELINGLAEML